MEYDEVIYKLSYWPVRQIVTYRFRTEPVPGVKKHRRSWFKCWYKTPRTTQERRWGYAHKEYVRGRRYGYNLPEAWDDYPRSDTFDKKSWKKSFKCRKQWGKHYVIR